MINAWIQPDVKTRTGRRCRVCGCSERNACVNTVTGLTCSWVQYDLCSACAPAPKQTRLLPKEAA